MHILCVYVIKVCANIVLRTQVTKYLYVYTFINIYMYFILCLLIYGCINVNAYDLQRYVVHTYIGFLKHDICIF